MKLKSIFASFIMTLLITVNILVLYTPALAVTPLETTYNLYQKNNLSRLVTTMTIFNQKGNSFLIQGDKWGGSGNINGTEGYYDWKFLDGRTGRTTFTVQSDSSLIGHVSGSGIDWVYIAIPQSNPKPLPEPKSCNSCFEDEKTSNRGCTGTSVEQLACIHNNRSVREKCQETCKLP